MINRGDGREVCKDVLVRGVFGVEESVEVLSPSVQDLGCILDEGNSVCRSDWGYVFSLWTVYGFDGIVKSMGVVGIGIELDLFGFLDPPVILHGSESTLDFGSAGGELSL